MASSDHVSKCPPIKTEEETAIFAKYLELTSQLPTWKLLSDLNSYPDVSNRLFLGQWRTELHIPGIMAMRDHFRARPGDTLVASYPKCGTTWLKALVHSIATRNDHPLHLHPLLTHNPHELIPLLEDKYSTGKLPDLDASPPPRFFATHVFYSDLPDSAREQCKIVYICREPKDNFTSLWHAQETIFQIEGRPPTTWEVETYCQGKAAVGSIWDHMNGYWKAHKEDPGRVMFVRFEDLKRDVKGVVRRLGEFLGFPFTEEEEEREGVVEGIVQLCSLESLKGMEVNKSGNTGERFVLQNTTYFRKGEVGDWVNLLTPEMEEMIDKVTEEKLAGTGLSFRTGLNIGL